jgi:hypothetical protein
MKPFPSHSGMRFLMNSRSDGRINSATIPLSDDFDFLQTSQIRVAGAVLLIGSRSQIKTVVAGLSIPSRIGDCRS